MNVPLREQTVVVTGGGRGYGEQMAKALAKEGAAITVASRTESECMKVAEEICIEGGRAIGVQTDIGQLVDVQAMVEATLEAFDRIDVLINNAADPGAVGPVAATGEEVWLKTLDVNLIGSLRCVRAVLPDMMARMSGQIVNLSSGTARLGYRHIRSLSYTTSKHALEGFSSGLAVELEPYGIRVNAFTPGLAQTRFLSNMPEGYLRGLKCQTPEHVGPAIIYLLTSDFPSGERFEALAWLEEEGLLEQFSYVHD